MYSYVYMSTSMSEGIVRTMYEYIRTYVCMSVCCMYVYVLTTIVCTIVPVLRDHCMYSEPVLRDHCIYSEPVLRDHRIYSEPVLRDHCMYIRVYSMHFDLLCVPCSEKVKSTLEADNKSLGIAVAENQAKVDELSKVNNANVQSLQDRSSVIEEENRKLKDQLSKKDVEVCVDHVVIQHAVDLVHQTHCGPHCDTTCG